MHEAANARICSINAAMTHESAKAREAHHMARITLFQRRLDEALKGGSSSLAAVEALQAVWPMPDREAPRSLRGRCAPIGRF